MVAPLEGLDAERQEQDVARVRVDRLRRWRAPGSRPAAASRRRCTRSAGPARPPSRATAHSPPGRASGPCAFRCCSGWRSDTVLSFQSRPAVMVSRCCSRIARRCGVASDACSGNQSITGRSASMLALAMRDADQQCDHALADGAHVVQGAGIEGDAACEPVTGGLVLGGEIGFGQQLAAVARTSTAWVSGARATANVDRLGDGLTRGLARAVLRVVQRAWRFGRRTRCRPRRPTRRQPRPGNGAAASAGWPSAAAQDHRRKTRMRLTSPCAA